MPFPFAFAFLIYVLVLGSLTANAEPSHCPTRANVLDRSLTLYMNGRSSETDIFAEKETHFADLIATAIPEKAHAADETIVVTVKTGGYVVAFGIEGRFCVFEDITANEDLRVGEEYRKRKELAKSQHDI